ncbi:hypothetical protein B0H13DRAFT_1024922 [Mycena leptocephala]|nr:hypothetical protein B0H13DRAFT_1024922 [Mycena leptocephala]
MLLRFFFLFVFVRFVVLRRRLSIWIFHFLLFLGFPPCVRIHSAGIHYTPSPSPLYTLHSPSPLYTLPFPSPHSLLPLIRPDAPPLDLPPLYRELEEEEVSQCTICNIFFCLIYLSTATCVCIGPG